ncbi:hypothetical protein PVAP13_5KG390528 [Panicum virgatum]|uniref:Uncharacterized protein n=1 Tax=Panicum virgatum TaxID=38727 RepID=A0A8T0SHS5_PANVG|nr:hypothetical protein PVAP13_5KG390528 [Panicum virgatum]
MKIPTPRPGEPKQASPQAGGRRSHTTNPGPPKISRPARGKERETDRAFPASPERSGFQIFFIPTASPPHLFPCLPALRKASSILSSFLPTRWLPSISPSPRDIFPCHRPSLYIQPVRPRRFPSLVAIAVSSATIPGTCRTADALAAAREDTTGRRKERGRSAEEEEGQSAQSRVIWGG